jgi:hypothetical protein
MEAQIDVILSGGERSRRSSEEDSGSSSNLAVGARRYHSRGELDSQAPRLGPCNIADGRLRHRQWTIGEIALFF